MVALSVSTSQSTSPLATLSPSFFLHRAIVPVSMVGESAIMGIFSGIHHPFHCFDDLGNRWLRGELEGVIVGHGHVLRRDELYGRVQVVKAVAGDEPCHVRSHAGK